MQIKSLFVLASLAVSSFAEASVAQVQNDIHYQMASAVTDFNTAVQSFSIFTGTPRQALTIHYAANVLNSVIANTTSDINGLSSQFSDAEAQDLFGHLHSLEPSFLNSLGGLVTRKLAIEFIQGLPALIKQDLATMKLRADDFMDAFISHAPPSVLAEAWAMKGSVDAMFGSLLLLYSF